MSIEQPAPPSDPPGFFKAMADFFAENYMIKGLLNIVALLSIIFTVFFATSPKPELCIGERVPRTAIVVPETPSNLNVDYGGEKIVGPISSVNLVFWNDGSALVFGKDQRRPVSIALSSRILEAKVLKTSRKEVEATVTKEPSSDKRVTLQWNLLENGDGAEIQLIYAGDSEVPLLVDGSVINQRAIRHVKQPTKQELGKYPMIGAFSGALAVMLIEAYIYRPYRQKRIQTDDPKVKRSLQLRFVLTAVTIVLAVCLVFGLGMRTFIDPNIPSF